MKPSLIRQIIWKDAQLHRTSIVLTLIVGAAALSTLLLQREPVSVMGAVTLFIALIVMSAMLAASNILSERKKQTLPFLMSLPISAMQYTTAKLVSTVGMFLIPWLAMVSGAMWLIEVRGVLPHGTIPLTLILLTLPLVGLCGIIAMTLVGETDGWNIAGNVIFNSAPGLTWYFIARSPALMGSVRNAAPDWNSAVLWFLFSEFASIVVILAFTFYLQSRKRDFI